MNPLIPHFQMMARYNRLANERLYDCCAQLADAERKKNRQAFFKSIHGTLNHIMVGDRNWMTRFEGGVASSAHLDARCSRRRGKERRAKVDHETADPTGQKWARRGAIAGGVVRLIFAPSLIGAADAR